MSVLNCVSDLGDKLLKLSRSWL